MKGCVSQKNSYIFTDKLHADLDNIQKGCGGRWGEGRGVKKKKKPQEEKIWNHTQPEHAYLLGDAISSAF